MVSFVFFFFFQAEDGIRDFHVTGVQTCALPIFAFRSITDHDATWVGEGRSKIRVLMPLLAKISDTVLAKSSEANLQSYPMMASGSLERDFMYCALPCATRRTLPKVKSSAMTPRQPSVPNLIGCPAISLQG